MTEKEDLALQLKKEAREIIKQVAPVMMEKSPASVLLALLIMQDSLKIMYRNDKAALDMLEGIEQDYKGLPSIKFAPKKRKPWFFF